MFKKSRCYVLFLFFFISISLMLTLCTSYRASASELCDINGDGKVDIIDLAEAAKNYNLTKNNKGWDSKYDLNYDSIIDIYDLVEISKSFGENLLQYKNANISNLGFTTPYNNWVYYTDDMDGFLYKKMPDDSKKTKLSNDTALFINIHNDWIYYRNESDSGKLYKIKIDGSSRTKLSDDNVTYIYTSNDGIYYFNNSKDIGLYKINLNGTNRQKVSSLITSPIYDITFDGNWFYYIDGSDKCIYKIKPNGSSKIKITNATTSKFIKKGDYLYFINTSYYNKLYKIKTDGGNETLVLDYEVYALNTVDNWIFYCYQDKDYIYKINKMLPDGSNKTLINEGYCSYINIVGDWIYFLNNLSNGAVYKVKIDGSERNLQDSISHSSKTPNIMGTTNGNAMNNSFLSIQDNWLYYTAYLSLFKTTTDGKYTYQLTQGSENINVVGDWIYYTIPRPNYGDSNWLYKIKTDGSRKTLLSTDYCKNLIVYKDSIYYFNFKDQHIYKLKTDGTGKIPLTLDYCGSTFNIVGDWIYYHTGESIKKVKLDGTEDQVIRDISDNELLNVNDTWIYYKLYGQTQLYRMSLDGKKLDKILDLAGFNIIFKDNYIYYYYYSEDDRHSKIYRINLDGTNKTLLFDIDEDIDRFNICDEWLFYYTRSNVCNFFHLGKN